MYLEQMDLNIFDNYFCAETISARFSNMNKTCARLMYGPTLLLGELLIACLRLSEANTGVAVML